MTAPRVLLGVSGGIAAYKSAEIVRALVDRGAEVRAIMTPAAQKFLAPLTLAVLSKHPVVSDLWDPASGAVDHIELARWADVLAVAPATADILAKLANGLGDDVLTTYALAHRTALLIAPSMNTWMWAHPATRANLATLRARGAHVVEPESGDLACGDHGPGRLAPPAAIVEAILESARRSRELAGRHVVVTAGPTREPVDPVRFLSNRSSGRMGYALAAELVRRGADVTLVSGPVSLEAPPAVRLVRVERAAEMRDAVVAATAEADALVMAAAPADFAVESPSPQKLKRSSGPPRLVLVPAPDILKEVRARRPGGLVVVAFAAETEHVTENARRKLLDKGADLLVANDVSKTGIGFDADENEVVILSADGADQVVARAAKTSVARHIVDRLAHLLLSCRSEQSAVPAVR